MTFQIGDKVICNEDGVHGTVADVYPILGCVYVIESKDGKEYGVIYYPHEIDLKGEQA